MSSPAGLTKLRKKRAIPAEEYSFCGMCELGHIEYVKRCYR